MSNVQQLINELRDSGLSQTEIARRIGSTQSRISRWQKRGVPVAVEDAAKLVALHSEVFAAELQINSHGM